MRSLKMLLLLFGFGIDWLPQSPKMVTGKKFLSFWTKSSLRLWVLHFEAIQVRTWVRGLAAGSRGRRSNRGFIHFGFESRSWKGISLIRPIFDGLFECLFASLGNFFLTTTMPNALPRQGTRLIRSGPKPQMECTPDLVPTYAGGAFLHRNSSTSSTTLVQAQLSLKSWLDRIHLLYFLL